MAIGAALLEQWLERRDRELLMPGQTFATVGDARVRYRRLGLGKPGSTVVLLTGFTGCLEQLDKLQTAVSTHAPTLTYDRGGYGFSQGSRAYTAEQQADELDGLLRALEVREPVVVVGYSSTAVLARVFASRHPASTAALFLVDPYVPEIEGQIPGRHDPRRAYVRYVMHELFSSTFGFLRFRLWRQNRGIERPDVEKRADAVLARSSHYWAIAREWWVVLDSSRQAREAKLEASIPIEVLSVQSPQSDETSRKLAELNRALVAQSKGGVMRELEGVDHTQLKVSGPGFDAVTRSIVRLAKASDAVEAAVSP